MDYTIVIPSYKRAELCRDKTLAVLHRYKIPKEQIVVVVANKEEKETYEEILDPKTYKEILVGVPGLANVRNWIFNGSAPPILNATVKTFMCMTATY